MENCTAEAARPATAQEAARIHEAVETIQRAIETLRRQDPAYYKRSVKRAGRHAALLQKQLEAQSPVVRFSKERAFVYSAVQDYFGWLVSPPRNDAIRVFLILGFAVYLEAVHGADHDVRLRAWSAIAKINVKQRLSLILLLIVEMPEHALDRLFGEVLRLLDLPALPALTDIEATLQ